MMYRFVFPAMCRIQRCTSLRTSQILKQLQPLSKPDCFRMGSCNAQFCNSAKQYSHSQYFSLGLSVSRVLCASSIDATQKRCKATLPEKFVACMPTDLQPYLKLMRVDKPTGTWLLLWPCYWSLAMGSAPGSFPDPVMLALFGSGAFLMRSAGCIINDIWDKDLDSKVSRTKNRPLATGELSVLDAVMLLGGQLSLACLILLQLNWYSIVLGASSLSLVVVYPLVKRVFNYPQLILGLTFNWGALLGWSAINESCNWAVVLPLYGACICWTMVYDTIYAHQDKTDDLLINIKSTALKFGEQTKPWLAMFASCSTAGFLTSGYLQGQTWPYYVSIGIASMMYAKQIYTLNIHNPDDCFRKFQYNRHLGWVIFLGILCGTLWKKVQAKEDKQDRFDIVSIHVA